MSLYTLNLHLKPVVRKSRSMGLYKGSWYVLIFGRCIRFDTLLDAYCYACRNSSRHKKWVQSRTTRKGR